MLASGEPIHAKRPSSFLEFNFKSYYMPGFDLPDKLLYKIAVPLSTELESKSDDMWPWSNKLIDELFYEVAAQFSDEKK